mgnify:FL=1
MIGEQLQLPPTYSAKMIDGKRAYEYARQGADVEMKRAPITIYSMEIESFCLPRLTLRIRCSKGTYIRSIARDLGEALNSGAFLYTLCRTKNGNYTLDDTFTPEQIELALFPNQEQNDSEQNLEKTHKRNIDRCF